MVTFMIVVDATNKVPTLGSKRFLCLMPITAPGKVISGRIDDKKGHSRMGTYRCAA